jgi:hypothetical protein
MIDGNVLSPEQLYNGVFTLHRSLIVFGFCLSLCASRGFAQSADPEVPEANPARPTVASPATLTPVGYLQFENGVQYATGSPDFSGRTGFNQVTKLTVHPRLQFLVLSEPFAYSGQNGTHSSDTGDIFLGIQGVLLPGKAARPTIALSYIRHVYTGTAPSLDVGTAENSVSILYSQDLRGFHFDINGFWNEERQDPVRRAQFGHTVSVSHGLPGKFTISAELWRFTQPFERGNAVGNLWALSYQARKNLVFDGGFNRGLTSTSTTWTAFAGFTYLLPHRLWRSNEPKTPTNKDESSGAKK